MLLKLRHFCKSRRSSKFVMESSFLFQDSSPGMNENDAKLLARKVHQFLSQKTSKFKFAFSEVQVLSQVTMAFFKGLVPSSEETSF